MYLSKTESMLWIHQISLQLKAISFGVLCNTTRHVFWLHGGTSQQWSINVWGASCRQRMFRSNEPPTLGDKCIRRLRQQHHLQSANLASWTVNKEWNCLRRQNPNAIQSESPFSHFLNSVRFRISSFNGRRRWKLGVMGSADVLFKTTVELASQLLRLVPLTKSQP